MVLQRWALPLLASLLVTPVVAQEPPDEAAIEAQIAAKIAAEPPMTKPQERAKYHSEVVRGTTAADRLKAFDQTVEMRKASYFEGVKWRNIGPEVQGGRVMAFAAPETDPSTLYVAFATGGLYKTTDEGVTWTSLFEDHASFGIGAIAVSKEGKTLWVGSGEANSQRTSYSGTGVYKSMDGGKTWQHMGLPESHHIGKVLIDPKDENTVYVAVLGHLYSQNPERGVYKTTDGGKTWKQTLKVDEFTGAIDLAFDPSNPSIVYASMWDRDRRAWNFRESGPGSGLFRSANGGTTWSKVATVPSGDSAGRIGVATSAKNPAVVYAFIDNNDRDPEWADKDERIASGKLTIARFLLLNDTTFVALDEKLLKDFLDTYPKAKVEAKGAQADVKSGKTKFADVLAKLKTEYPERFVGNVLQSEVYRSDDHGKTFKRVSQLGQLGGYYYGTVFANPADADELYVSGVPIYRSKDGGKTWKSVAKEAHVDYHAVWFDPRTKGKTWFGNDGGIYVSPDAGDHVRHINNLSVAQATTVAVDNKRPYNVMVGNQDNGTMRGPNTYKPGTSNVDDWKDLFGGDGSAIAVDPRDNGTGVIVSFQFGQFFFTDDKGTRAITPPAGKDGVPLRFNWIAPVVISAFHPDIVYIGSQKIHRSFDSGKKWADISGDLTKGLPAGDVPYSTTKDISESPLRFGLLYVGCDDGNVQMTPDNGVTWKAIPTPQPKKWVSRVVASKYDVNTVYCSQSGYREDDFSAYLWKSTDQGKTWTSIVGDLPAQTINVIREDTKDAKTLYIGTDLGAYVSQDGGVHWMALHGGMPTLPVHDLVIQEREDDLVAATHARGAYVLNLASVRKLPSLLEKDLTILKADDMTVSTRWGFERVGVADEPPASPKLRGSFFAKAAGAVVVRLKAADGKVVMEKKQDGLRGFNDFELSLELTPRKPAPNTIPGRKPTDVTGVLADPFAEYRPTYLAAGTYTLEVTVGDKVISQPWKLEK